MDAGRLSTKVRFERQTVSDDGHGNDNAAWVLMAGCPEGGFSAEFTPEYGRETVAAGRREATMLGVVRVRRCAFTASVTAADRIVFARAPYAGVTAQINAQPLPTPDRESIEFSVETNVAQ